MMNAVRFGADYVFKPSEQNKKTLTSANQASEFMREVLTNDRFSHYGGKVLAVDPETGNVYLSTDQKAGEGFKPQDARLVALVIGNLVSVLEKRSQNKSANGFQKKDEDAKSITPAYQQLANLLLEPFRKRTEFDETFEY